MSQVARERCNFVMRWTDAMGYVHEWRCKKKRVTRRMCRVHMRKTTAKQGDFRPTVSARRAREHRDAEARFNAHVILRVRQKEFRKKKGGA